MSKVEHLDVLVVGAGLSGIDAGYWLKTKSPDRSFAIFEARDAIAALLEPWFAVRDRAQAELELKAGKATYGSYDTVSDMLARDPRMSAASNPVFERIDTPGIGEHIAAGSALRAAGLEREPTSPAALLGAHTDEVLHQVLGLDGAAIGRLHDAGVVAGTEADPTVD